MNEPIATPANLPGAPPDAVVLRDDRGEIAIWTPRPGVLRSVLRGYLSTSLAEQIVATMARILGDRPTDLFHDWSGYLGHDAAARAAMTQWAFRNRSQLRSLNILMPAPSKMVSMAIAASNMVLGGVMRIHHARSTFDSELARVVGR